MNNQLVEITVETCQDFIDNCSLYHEDEWDEKVSVQDICEKEYAYDYNENGIEKIHTGTDLIIISDPENSSKKYPTRII